MFTGVFGLTLTSSCDLHGMCAVAWARSPLPALILQLPPSHWPLFPKSFQFFDFQLFSKTRGKISPPFERWVVFCSVLFSVRLTRPLCPAALFSDLWGYRSHQIINSGVRDHFLFIFILFSVFQGEGFRFSHGGMMEWMADWTRSPSFSQTEGIPGTAS